MSGVGWLRYNLAMNSFESLRAAVNDALGKALSPYKAYLAGWAGADVLLVKSVPSQAELEQGSPFCGEDLTALLAALESLGWGQDNWCGVLTAAPNQKVLPTSDLRLIIEINDPMLIITLDENARLALLQALDSGDKNKGLSPKTNSPTTFAVGEISSASGRQLLALSDFEASLADEQSKQQVWAQLKQISRSS